MRALTCLLAVWVGTAPLASAQPLPLSPLPIDLLGVVVDSRVPGHSTCLVRCTYPAELRRTSIVEVARTACDTAEVIEVHADGVVVRNLLTNRLERLAFPGEGRTTAASSRVPAQAPPAPTVVTTSPEAVDVEVPRATVEQYVANLPEILSSALATPHYAATGGGPPSIDGFQISQVKPGGVVEKLGIKDGDVIQEVNGQRLDSLATVIRLFGEAQASAHSTLTVLRDGQRVTFNFRTR